MPKGPNLKIPWDVFISFHSSEASCWKELGNNLASKLTTFVDTSEDYHTKMPFLLRKVVTDSSHPLNKYFLDRDVTRLLKRSYSDSSIKDVVEDSSILECFLGQQNRANKHFRMSLKKSGRRCNCTECVSRDVNS